MGEVTELLQAWQKGDQEAGDEAFRLVYQELRKTAHAYQRWPGHELNTTALVNEAYLKLVKVQQTIANRKHFFVLAARCMRQILLDEARAQQAQKRGGPAHQKVELEETLLGYENNLEMQLMIDEALKQLQAERPEHYETFELQYTWGTPVAEIAELTGCPQSTVEKRLKFARAWLKSALIGLYKGRK